MRVLLFLIIALVIFGLPIFFFVKAIKNKNTKQRESSWKGELVDKKHLEWEDDDSPYSKDLYTLYFKTTSGEEIKIDVAKDVYNDWKIGEKAEKTEGQLLPRKVT